MIQFPHLTVKPMFGLAGRRLPEMDSGAAASSSALSYPPRRFTAPRILINESIAKHVATIRSGAHRSNRPQSCKTLYTSHRSASCVG